MTVVDTPQENAVAAGLDRRFYAFAIDRLIAWTIFALAGIGGWVISGDALTTVLVVLAVVLLVSLLWAMMVGLAGVTPGKAALGLRVVRRESGGPLGVGRALLRQFVLGVGGLPVFGIGIGVLAWTAVMDRSGLRRGWHDLVSHSAVVDVRPPEAVGVEDAPAPRRIVNLTAMRLMPVPPTPEPAAPVPAPAPPPAAPEQAPAAGEVPQVPPVPQPVEPTAYPSEPAAPQPEAPQPATWAPTVPPAPEPESAPAPEPELPPAPRVPHTAAIQMPQEPEPQLPPAPESPAPSAPGPVPQPPPAHPDPTPTQTPLPPAPQESTQGRHLAATPQSATAIRWQVSFDTGESFVVEGLALVGRKPEARAGEPVAHLVALPSSDMSLSKTHAQFQVAPDGALVVMDRGSTNGSVLIRAGVSRALGARKPATVREGDRVRFGDREMTVARA